MIHVLVIEYGRILAAVGGYVRSGGEGVANPLDGLAPFGTAIDADDVESCRVRRHSGAGRKEHVCRSDKLALFAPVHGHGRARESAGRTKTNFHEHEALFIEHDEVDFAVPAAVIALDRLQSPGLQVLVREFLGSKA
jgi:hypothetical protein